MTRVEKALIRRALAASGGNRARAAEALGIRRQLLYQKLARFGWDMSPDATEGVAERDSPDTEEPG